MTVLASQVDASMRALVVQIAREWLGTPYHHHARIKGVGVDCAQLLCAVYEEAGLVSPVDTGHYPHDWHLHRSEEMFLAWLRRVGAAIVEEPLAGDVAVFRFGRAFSHGAVMVDERTCIHSYINQGVILTRLDEEPLVGRTVQFWSVHDGR
jgi:cell wall-associated NlpC family hydrolase